ncbi:alpha/beta-hydrolase N-terminal domain-containing protein [Halomonas sp. 11-S5]|uniref:alpha/beta-hydrolase N-terminal domain-containing protein n=1 Tax=Halomonas sp. 11-S5 TaxID=2994064 RepID=UPI0024683398|nr:alpha/beta-hydrolase N-terminal domain-containing protein [Halomonas sp. 11-S5]
MPAEPSVALPALGRSLKAHRPQASTSGKGGDRPDAAAQGIVSGLSFSAGYVLGVAGHWLWAYRHLPEPGPCLLSLASITAMGWCFW